MAFVDPKTPNLPDFITFCREQGVSVAVLPDDSDYFAWAFYQAKEIALNVLTVTCVMPGIYVLAVYNYGMHTLLKIAQDETNLPITALTWAATLVTATTTFDLSSAVGNTLGIRVSGAVPVGYNGKFSDKDAAYVISGNSFSYIVPTDPGANTTPGTFSMTFFADARKAYGLLSFVTGPVASSFDQGTGQSLVVPDFMKGLTFSALDLMKTPWGLWYLDYAQQYGPNVVGVS